MNLGSQASALSLSPLALPFKVAFVLRAWGIEAEAHRGCWDLCRLQLPLYYAALLLNGGLNEKKPSVHPLEEGFYSLHPNHCLQVLISVEKT